MFSSHNYHQNYQNYHHNYHWNHHYHHQKIFWSYAQNVVFDVKKRGPSRRNWGQGGGRGFRWFGQCPKENVFFLLMSSITFLLFTEDSTILVKPSFCPKDGCFVPCMGWWQFFTNWALSVVRRLCDLGRRRRHRGWLICEPNGVCSLAVCLYDLLFCPLIL